MIWRVAWRNGSLRGFLGFLTTTYCTLVNINVALVSLVWMNLIAIP